MIAAHTDLQERELIKLASLAAALADTLRQRGVAEPTASLAAEAGIAVFRVAFERWIDEANQQAFSDLMRESFDALKAVAAAPSFVDALYAGLLGDKADGVYPGRAGKNSIISGPPANGRLSLARVAVRKKAVLAVKGTPSATIAARRCRE